MAGPGKRRSGGSALGWCVPFFARAGEKSPFSGDHQVPQACMCRNRKSESPPPPPPPKKKKKRRGRCGGSFPLNEPEKGALKKDTSWLCSFACYFYVLIGFSLWCSIHLAPYGSGCYSRIPVQMVGPIPMQYMSTIGPKQDSWGGMDGPGPFCKKFG